MTAIRSGGNAPVIRMLETCLKAAQDNPTIAHVTVSFLYADQPKAGGGWAGDAALDPRSERALRTMADETRERIINRTMPPRDENVPADYVVYNVPDGSISFDFLVWLVDCEMVRIQENAPPPLKVHFWRGRDGKSGLGMPEQQQMFEKVIKPSLDLVGAIEHPDAIHGRDYPRRHMRHISDGARQGQQVPIFKAPYRAREAMKQWLGAGPAPITITLREAKHWPHRNSNLDAWRTFAYDLERQGERVVFVRDTANADEPIDGFEICPPASTNLHMRMALYEQSKANLFIANGPVTLAQFSDRPWFCFTPIEPDDSLYYANTPAFWRMYIGVDVGEQFPWSAPDQRIIWKPDTYENISAAWAEFEKCVVNKMAAE